MSFFYTIQSNKPTCVWPTLLVDMLERAVRGEEGEVDRAIQERERARFLKEKVQVELRDTEAVKTALQDGTKDKLKRKGKGKGKGAAKKKKSFRPTDAALQKARSAARAKTTDQAKPKSGNLAKNGHNLPLTKGNCSFYHQSEICAIFVQI